MVGVDIGNKEIAEKSFGITVNTLKFCRTSNIMYISLPFHTQLFGSELYMCKHYINRFKLTFLDIKDIKETLANLANIWSIEEMS